MSVVSMSLGDDDFAQQWGILEPVVLQIVKCMKLERSVWHDCFFRVYKLCNSPKEDESVDHLYNSLKECLQSHLKNLLSELHSTAGDEAMLYLYNSHWSIFSKGVGILHHLFNHMNVQLGRGSNVPGDTIFSSSISTSESLMVVEHLGMHLWKKVLVVPLAERLKSQIVWMIDGDRSSEIANPGIVHDIIQSFVQVSSFDSENRLLLYKDLFEEPFLTKTYEYYSGLAEEMLKTLTVSEYMHKVLHYKKQEEVRFRKFLHTSSYDDAQSTYLRAMVGDHLQLIHEECENLIENEATSDLSIMHCLLKPVPGGLGTVASSLESHITSQGRQKLDSCETSSSGYASVFVNTILQIHSKFSTMVNSTFDRDVLFNSALDRACSKMINYRADPKQPSKAPELLAQHCDAILRKSARAYSEPEIDDKLGEATKVFVYLDDKDIFQHHYRRMLSKRLILELSVSVDLEETMVSRLKQACGFEFTSKLQRMITDIKIRDDMNANFSGHLTSNDIALPCGFTTCIIQHNAWPNHPQPTTFDLPRELEFCLHTFEGFYHKQCSGRRLQWLHSFSSVELRTMYLPRQYSISCTVYQTGILFRFNSKDSLSFGELEAGTRLGDLEKQLSILVDSKLLCVEAHPGGDRKENVYRLNLKYSNKRIKFKLNAAMQKLAPKEVDQVKTQVHDDRKNFIHAAIVRIMKARKTLKHTPLVQAVISQAANHFTPNIALIKKSIEQLIDKGYLERSPNELDTYQYVA